VYVLGTRGQWLSWW